MLSLLYPLPTSTSRVGGVITKNQPDVEVLALCLQDVPRTAAEFNIQRRNHEYIICKFLVVGVGTPGFAKVPYLSKKRKGEKEEDSKALYETSGDGAVRMYAFDKGPTNKDKGCRVESNSTTGAVCPGVCLTFFIREEMFEVGKILADHNITRNSQVCLQLASSNIDSATKGYLLKLKKIKHMHTPFDLQCNFKNMPKNEVEYETLINHARETYPAMRGSLDSNTDNKFFVVEKLGTQAFADFEGDDFVICNAKSHNQEGFADEIAVSREMVLSCIGCQWNEKLGEDEKEKMLKKALLVFNVALAMNSISVLIKSSVGSTIALNSDKISPPMSAIAMNWNQNSFLRLDELAKPNISTALAELMTPSAKTRLPITFLHHKLEDMTVSGYKSADSDLWSLTYGHKSDKYCDHTDKLYNIYFQVNEEVTNNNEEADEATSYLSLQGSGPHNHVHVLLQPINEEGPANKIITLQLRRDRALAGTKRKRPNVYLEHYD